MNKAAHSKWLALAALALLPVSAYAVMGDLATEAPVTEPRMPAPQATPFPQASQVADVPVLSGGIGDDMQALKSAEHEYNLKLMFTEGNGLYLADVPVSITDKRGQTVLNTVSNGPVMLVKLPAGAYTVKASQENQTKEEKVAVGNSLTTRQFRFPTVDENPKD